MWCNLYNTIYLKNNTLDLNGFKKQISSINSCQTAALQRIQTPGSELKVFVDRKTQNKYQLFWKACVHIEEK